MTNSRRKSNPRLQHFLPRAFLEGFARDGNLHVEDLVSGQALTPSPSNFAKQRDFYTFVNTDGEHDFSVETDLFSEIDGKGAAALAGIAKTSALPTGHEWEALKLFVVALSLRIPRARQAAYEIISHAADLQLHARFGTREAFEADKAAFESETGTCIDVSYDEIRRMIDSGEIGVDVHRNNYIQLMLRLIPRVASIVTKMTGRLLVAPGRARFITGDVPVNKIDGTANPDVPSPAGWTTPGVEVYVPLNSTTCLALDWGRWPTGVVTANTNAVAHCNTLMLGNAARYVIGEAPDFPWVHRDGQLRWGLDAEAKAEASEYKKNRPAVVISGGPIPRRPPEPYGR